MIVCIAINNTKTENLTHPESQSSPSSTSSVSQRNWHKINAKEMTNVKNMAAGHTAITYP